MATCKIEKSGIKREKSSTGLTIRIVDQRKDVDRFDQLLKDRHYLGEADRVGDFLRQVVERDGQWVALLAWGPACYALKDRDRWIGWHPTQRVERLKLIAQNRRFLLLKERGEEPNLASACLAISLRSLRTHWRSAFGYEPVLAETFTDPEAYAGTCYKASGWLALGKTRGYGRHRADFYIKHDQPKKLWIKPLTRDAQAILCASTLPEAQQPGQTSAPTGTLPIPSGHLRSFFEALQTVPDPRAGNTRFRLGSVLAVVVLALMCGLCDISQIQRFGWRLSQKQRGLLGFPMKKGSKRFREIPGYTVYYEVLRRLDLDALTRVLNGWLAARAGNLPGALALDGKMIHGLVGTLSLVEHDTGMPVAVAVINQKEGDSEHCEMKAAQRLLAEVPSLDGRLVTGDALHTQRETAQVLVRRGADYLLQVKGNQKQLHRHIAKVTQKKTPPLSGKRKKNTDGSSSAT